MDRRSTRARDGKGRVFLLSSLYWLVARGVVFFFVLSLMLFALYFLGNFQEFLDSTQIFLLDALRLSLLAEVFLGILYVFLVFFLKRQRRFLGKLILCSLSVVFCWTLLLGVSFLSAWFQL